MVSYAANQFFETNKSGLVLKQATVNTDASMLSYAMVNEHRLQFVQGNKQLCHSASLQRNRRNKIGGAIGTCTNGPGGMIIHICT